MAIVRYAALAALVVWLGVLTNAAARDAFRHVHLVSAICGGVVLLALVAMKFIGPPPRAFFVRTAIVATMIAAIGATIVFPGASEMMIAATAALGFVLLAWYAHE